MLDCSTCTRRSTGWEWAGFEMSSRGGSFAERFVGVLHRLFEFLANRFPSVLQRDVTTAFPFAGIGAVLSAAAALAGTFILTGALMSCRGRAGSLAGTRVVAAGPFSFASIQSSADVRLLKQ